MSETRANKSYYTPLPGVFAGILQQALNTQLGADEKALELIKKLGDRVLAIELTGTGMDLFFQAADTGLVVTADHSSEVSTWIRGTPPALFGMAKPELAKPGWANAGSKVTIEGDASLVRDFESLMNRLDFDWEEKISGVLGDVVAHQLGLAARSFGGFARKFAEFGLDAGRSSLQDIAVKQAGNFTGRAAFCEFSDAVASLDNEVSALEKRFKQQAGN